MHLQLFPAKSNFLAANHDLLQVSTRETYFLLLSLHGKSCYCSR